MSGVGTWEGRPWPTLGSTLGSETTRKVCGGSGSSRAFASQVSVTPEFVF